MKLLLEKRSCESLKNNWQEKEQAILDYSSNEKLNVNILVG